MDNLWLKFKALPKGMKILIVGAVLIALLFISDKAFADGEAMSPGTAARTANFVPAPGFKRAPAMPLLRSHCTRNAEGLRKALEARHGERMTGFGAGTAIATPGRIVMFTDAEDGSWTVVNMRDDGIVCVMASGEGWRDVTDGVGS